MGQQIPHHSQAWIVLVLHRRAGKTIAVLNHLQRDALKTPNSRLAYIAPFYKQAKNIAWIYSNPTPNQLLMSLQLIRILSEIPKRKLNYSSMG